MVQYSPDMNEMYKYVMVQRIKDDPSYINIFSRDLTKPFFNDLKKIADPNNQWTQNTIISMSGETGSGKSIVMMSLGLAVFNKFSHKNMFFFDQQILDSADKFKPNSFIVRDENVQKGIYGLGSTRQASQFEVLAETCRKFGLNLGLVEPEFKQTAVTKIYLETIDYDIQRRITRCAIRDVKTMRYIGAVYIPVIKENNLEWIAYNKAKDNFMKSVREGNMQGAKADFDKIVDKVYADIDRDIYRTKKERRAYIMKKYPTHTSGEIDMISTLLEIEIRENG